MPVGEFLEVWARKYIGIVKKWAAKYNLDVGFLLAMVHVGSYFNPLSGTLLGGLIPFAPGRDTTGKGDGRGRPCACPKWADTSTVPII